MKFFSVVALLASAHALAAAAPSARVTSAALSNPLDALKLEDLAQTRERPLFAPSRRPPPPPAQAAAPGPAAVVAVQPPANDPPPFDLIGVVVGGDVRFVLLSSHNGHEVTRLRAGDEKDGWRVGEISFRSVVLEREGRAESVALAGPPAYTGATPTARAPTATEIADQRAEDAIPPGPLREAYKRIRRQIAAKH